MKPKIHLGEKTISSTDGAGKNELGHIEELNWFLSLTLQKTHVLMDQGLQPKIWYPESVIEESMEYTKHTRKTFWTRPK